MQYTLHQSNLLYQVLCNTYKHLSCCRNSGILAGKFLERSRITKPGSSTDNPDYYQTKDFVIGATIHAFEHKFVITNADEYVLKYMEANRQDFSDDMIAALKHKYPKYKSSVQDKQTWIRTHHYEQKLLLPCSISNIYFWHIMSIVAVFLCDRKTVATKIEVIFEDL